MTVDLKDYDVLVVMKGPIFLRGMYAGDKVARWTSSAYEAWSIGSRMQAQKVADKLGGVVRTFNRITGQVR